MGPGRPGQEVRWKWKGRWRHGHLGDPPVEADGSLRVFDDFNGAARALRPSEVERLERGPRGGRRWVPCDPANWRVVITLYQRAGAGDAVQAGGQPVEVFQQLRGPVALFPDGAPDARAGAIGRAGRYADLHDEPWGERVDLVRVTMLYDDTEVWLSRDRDTARWTERPDPRLDRTTTTAAAPAAARLDAGRHPDPLVFRRVLCSQPVGRNRDVPVVAI